MTIHCYKFRTDCIHENGELFIANNKHGSGNEEKVLNCMYAVTRTIIEKHLALSRF